MWVTFIIGVIVTAIISMVFIWIGSKVYFSIKRENRKFRKEEKESLK